MRVKEVKVDIDLLSLKKELRTNFVNDDKEDIANMTDKITEKDIMCQRIGEFNVYFIKVQKGVIWKSGILISDPFTGMVSAMKDARKAML